MGSLALHAGVLWVGRHAKTAHVRPFDLDGRPLGPGFSFRTSGGRSSANGMAIDDDHRIWVADTPASRLRAFTLAGHEIGGIGGEVTDPRVDVPLPLAEPVAVALWNPTAQDGSAGDGLLVVGSRGHRRHALRVFEPDGTLVESLRPLGDPQDRFHGITSVAALERTVLVCEAGARRVQVFRDLDFHFAFRVPGPDGEAARPVAVAALRDGGALVACEDDGAGRLLRVDGAGAPAVVLVGPTSPGEAAGEEPGDEVLDGVVDVKVAEEADDRRSRVFVQDLEGERVRVFSLSGACFGSFDEVQ